MDNPSELDISHKMMLLHEAICRCPQCKGTCIQHEMCANCKRRDADIEQLNKQQRMNK